MSQLDAVPKSPAESTVSAVSREIVKLYKELTGRGPIKARTHLHSDCLLVLMREGHTVSEESLYRGGRGRDVAQSRVDLAGDVEARFIAAVEDLTGRKVSALMTSSHQHPDLISQVYVFAGSPLFSAVDDPPAESTGASDPA